MKTIARSMAVLALATAAGVAWPNASALAQQPGAAPAPPVPAPPTANPNAITDIDAPATNNPAAAAKSDGADDDSTEPAPPPSTLVPLSQGITIPPPPPAAPAKRGKKQRTTVGVVPTAPDFGSEADMISSADDDFGPPRPKNWNYAWRGFFRAPMRIGFGPRNDGTPGTQWHGPPRIPGASLDDWSYTGLGPSPIAALYAQVARANVSGTLILSTNTFYDSGYRNLVLMGGMSQAYVTFSLPDLFEGRGGLAWNVGAFSNRYGMAGPHQMSSGYYGTYLFGRTHVIGEALTAEYDLTDRLTLIAEHGFGAKLEVIPFILTAPGPPRAPYLPEQGPVAQGSNFVHHAHLALALDDWLLVAAHYMRSWSPNDCGSSDGCGFLISTVPFPMPRPTPDSSMTIMGGEAHVDTERYGNGYVGYSHIDASNLLALSDGVQALYGANGFGFKNNYFGQLPAGYAIIPPGGTAPTAGYLSPDDTGKVDTILFQYLIKVSQLLGHKEPARDLSLAVFAMYNHITYDHVTFDAASMAYTRTPVSQDRLKYGAEVEYTPLRFLSGGLRFDRVQPDGPNASLSYSAVSPRVIIHTNWLTREYVIINYTHYFLGSAVIPSAPYNATVKPDPNLLTISAVVSF